MGVGVAGRRSGWGANRDLSVDADRVVQGAVGGDSNEVARLTVLVQSVSQACNDKWAGLRCDRSGVEDLDRHRARGDGIAAGEKIDVNEGCPGAPAQRNLEPDLARHAFTGCDRQLAYLLDVTTCPAAGARDLCGQP